VKQLTLSKYYLTFSVCLLAIGLSFSLCYSQRGYIAEGQGHPKARNVILLVPDGMGLSSVTAARIYKNGPNGDPLYLETLPHIGYQRTHSANSSVTDSAAAASAWASGEKFRNGEISCHDNDRDGKCEPARVPTILEIAKKRGKATGLVATSTITHATPAAFGAHVPTRDCEKEIARQYIQVTGVDVILGGGVDVFKSAEDSADKCGSFGDFIADARRREYNVVHTKQQMESAAASGATKILGLFAPMGKTPELFRIVAEEPYPAEEPTLPHMTAAALEVLEKDRDGFFLLVEGSQIDWAGHRNSLPYQICETLAFDDAVKVVLDWVNDEPGRRSSTLIIVAPDHETGGLAINGASERRYQAGDLVGDLWTTQKHIADDVLIWSQGPGSRSLGRAVDNTHLHQVMKNALMQEP
jgi:alkaline phosphatase